MATIWDVAARAGVSKSTVSLVLNNSPLVKEETRQRVQSAIKALKYIPNNNARNLQKRNNNSIGIIHVPRIDRYTESKYGWDYGMGLFSRDVEDGIFSAITDSDTDMSVVKEHFRATSNPDDLPVLLKTCKVDCAIFIGGFDRKEEINFLSNLNLPSVLVTSVLEIDGVDIVMHDTVNGTKLAFEKLIELGHNKICLLNVPEHYRSWSNRIEGAKEASKEKNYTLDRELLISAEHNTAHSAYEAINKLLNKGITPDAVVTADNEMAMGAIRALNERGLRVPDDISIICYEDTCLCGNMIPPLSAVNIQKEKIGRLAVSLLLERLKNPDMPSKKVAVEPYLVMRDSVLDRR